ncbi:MAG: chromosome segregation protein SMC, partial [Treponemataceae bacterium]|nr:chromosome segregation protein SMC [Treponemataceae bacterium]
DESAQEIERLNEERARFQQELTAITEDIVTELDAKLRDSGFSSAESQKSKEALLTSIGKLRVYADGRRNIFSDFAAISGHGENECKQLADDAVSALDEIGSLIKDIENAVETYAATMPAFIDEFLAPEGIITQKRGIDGKIAQNAQKIVTIQEHIADCRSQNADLAAKIDEYKDTLAKLRVNEGTMRAQIDAARQQTDILRRSLANEQATLRQTENDLYAEQQRQEDYDGQIYEIQQTLAQIEEQGRACVKAISDLNDEIDRCNSSVSGKQHDLRKKQDEQAKYQDQYEKLTLSLVTSDSDIKNIKQNFIDAHSRDLMEFEERMYKITTPTAVLRDKLFT